MGREEKRGLSIGVQEKDCSAGERRNQKDGRRHAGVRTNIISNME